MQMTIGIGTELGQTATGGFDSAPVVLPTSNLLQILSDGWRGIYPDVPDLGVQPETITVHRQGFDAFATPVLHKDFINVTTRVRQPYPDHTSFTVDHIALSDFIYAGDVIDGVANSSSRPYPKPIAMWLNHDRDHAKGPTHRLRLAVAHAHAHAKEGRPVTAVKFIASDGINQVEQIVSEMTATTFEASGLTVPHFAADIELAGLTQGEVLTLDAVIYPWVGEAFTISQNADSYPSPNLTTLRVLNDHTGEDGTAFAYVDALAGSDSTGLASETATDAQLAPFATIPAAAAAIRALNATAFGRANDTGGGIIRLVEGLHSFTPFKSHGSSVDVPLMIEAADPLKRSTTILTDGGASKFNGIPPMLKLRNITLRKTEGSVVFLDNGANSAGNLLVTEACVWDANNTSAYSAWVYRVGRFFQVNCAIGTGGDPRQGNFFSTESTMVTAVGCDSCAGTITYQAAGCSVLPEFTLRSATGSRPDMTGLFLGWNIFSNGTTSNPIISISGPIGPRGAAFVGNIVESWGASNNAAIRFNADGDASATQNVVIHHNTVVGERANLLYVDGPVDALKTASVRFNLFEQLNS